MKKYVTASLLALLLPFFTLQATALDVKVINGAGVHEAIMVEALAFCNEQLPFNLRLETKPLSCENPSACQEMLSSMKGENDAALIGLVRLEDKPDFHQTINTQRMIALVNVAPLLTDDQQQSTWRLQRMLMRSVAFLLNIVPAPDPYCVTRNYDSLDDFDAMGRNFTPPYNPVIKQRAREQSITLHLEPGDGVRTPMGR